MKIAISIGDLNGIGIEIALKAHEEISKICTPIYVIDQEMLKQAVNILKIEIPNHFNTLPCHDIFQITPSLATKESGTYSYNSFLRAVELAKEGKVDAISTLPINKEAWNKAGIKQKGHTDTLAKIFKQEAIMMIGCKKLFVALFTHHIPLKDVPSHIKAKPIKDFILNLYKEIKEKRIGVLGLNPHAGDNGVIGDEEREIKKAIEEANKEIGEDIFIGPLVPDTAFTPKMREEIQYFVCMYHDQGLIPAKALYFEESINISLNLPIIRTSVDHGTAYDKAYKNQNPSTKSYINSIKEAIKLKMKRIDAAS